MEASTERFSNWNNFSGKIKVAIIPLFYQHTTDKVFNFLLKEE